MSYARNVNQKLSAVFFNHARKIPQNNLKTGPERFLSRPFQFFLNNDLMSRTSTEVKPWFSQTIQP
jgi:hypothetical protein